MLQAYRRPNEQGSWVLRLVLINVIIFFLQILIAKFYQIRIEEIFGLNPNMVLKNLWIWQIFTYMFLHSPFNMLHIFFNMYLLWVFGTAVEQEWGSKKFLHYYIFSGLGAGLSILLLNAVTAPYSLTIGASGAIFALLLAFGILFPNAEILLFFIIPVKAKYLVLVYGLLEFYLMINASTGNISHIGHLGGLFFGFIYFLLFKRNDLPFTKKTQKPMEIIGEIKKKVDEIKGKTTQQAQTVTVKNAGLIKEKLEDSEEKDLPKEERKFLDALVKPFHDDQEKRGICVKEDFSTQDSYCQKCEYFNLCLHRDTTGIDHRVDD